MSQEIKKEYKYPPKLDCRFCKGTGINKNKMVCICRFVNHEASDAIGISLAQFAKRELKKMKNEE